LVAVLHSIRIGVSASRESRLRRSHLRGETRRRGVLSAASGVRSVAGGSSYPDGSAGAVGRCKGLRTRSLKPRTVTVSNRYILEPCATPASGANSTHPSPSARPFRLPFNGLAQSELRQIFCSDEVPSCAFSPGPEGVRSVQMGVGVAVPRTTARRKKHTSLGAGPYGFRN
jgi:hypothetical protein